MSSAKHGRVRCNARVCAKQLMTPSCGRAAAALRLKGAHAAARDDCLAACVNIWLLFQGVLLPASTDATCDALSPWLLCSYQLSVALGYSPVATPSCDDRQPCGVGQTDTEATSCPNS